MIVSHSVKMLLTEIFWYNYTKEYSTSRILSFDFKFCIVIWLCKNAALIKNSVLIEHSYFS